MTLHETQRELEEEMITLGKARYESALKSRGLASTHPGQALIVQNLEQVAKRLQDNIDWFTGLGENPGRAGRYAKTVIKYLVDVDPQVVAYIGMRRAVQGAGADDGQGEALATCAVGIASLVEEHLAFETFRNQEAKLANWWADRAAETNHEEHARKVMRTGTRINGIDLDWTEDAKLKIGLWIIEALEECGLVVHQERIERRKTVAYLTLTPPVLAYVREAHEACILAAPFMLPMIMQPLDWHTPFDGGYLSKRTKLVTGRIPRGHLDDLASSDLSEVYSALNAIQSTPWQVNEPVLRVLETLIASPAGAPGVPGTDEEPLPARPAGIPADVKISAMSKPEQEILRGFRRECKEVYDKRAADLSRRVSFTSMLYVAKRFAKEEQIFFPHQLDSRGRIYSIPTGLSPQGDDRSKSLLRFSEGKALGDNGAYWLAVHTANCWGEDKVPFDDRVKWVEENTDMIMEIGINPCDTVEQWACADSPWQFLAACFEWTGYQIQPEGFVSHLPIGMDGSCSGLQHFSAALRDPVGGKAVNLEPTGKVEDIYTEVANRVNLCLNSSTCDDSLIPWRGFVDRKIVKQPCMTYAYSSTLVGTRDMILAVLKKRPLNERPLGDVFALAVALAPVIRDAIETTVVKAAEAMDWLQKVAAIATDENKDLRWATPTGFHVVQRKTTFTSVRSSAWYSGKRIKLSLSSATTKLSKIHQKNGIAPNWVHSMDAAHLMLVVNNAQEEGISSFAMVHDSFGVHACDIDVLNKLIRVTFIDMYSPDRLKEFNSQIQAQLGAEVELPPVPGMGTLDLAGIEDSDYFFA